MFTPLVESETLSELSGCHPATDRPGLRVLVARPRHVLAPKLKASESVDRDQKDLADARALARHLEIEDDAPDIAA